MAFASGDKRHSARIPLRGLYAVNLRDHVAQQKQAKRFYVSGTVQGVGYRFFAQRVAESLGLSGYVKNLRDGRVEVYAVGVVEQLHVLRAELKRGPRHALVDRLDETDAQLENDVLGAWASGFSIEDD